MIRPYIVHVRGKLVVVHASAPIYAARRAKRGEGQVIDSWHELVVPLSRVITNPRGTHVPEQIPGQLELS